MSRYVLVILLSVCFAPSLCAQTQHPLTPEDALTSLRRGVHYFQDEVSVEGGYLWRYAADFSEQEGEVPASSTTVWVQPPGTPSVGMAYLTAWELTGDADCLAAAREAAMALMQGQLVSGGWDYRIEFKDADRKRYAYRADAESDASGSGRNVTTLDDNTTQAALTFLMRVDRALKFGDAKIHDAVMYALEKLMEAQYPNGAWPQRFSAPPNVKDFPVKPAGYPETWPRTHPQEDYRHYYTFNDNTMADAIEMMFLASEIYGSETYANAARRGGSFILLAQMPEPQPGWAQQYNSQMHPAWARKFEPPGVTGAESQRVMETLLRLFELTGDRRFLEPLPRALAYFRRSRLENGQLARFYELRTNRPLYFTKDYRMTYDDGDLPTHYGFKATSRLDRIQAKLDRVSAIDSKRPLARVLKEARAPKLTKELMEQTARVVASQDARGAWIEPAFHRDRSNIRKGTPSLHCSTFAFNVVTLARYIAAASADETR